MPNFFIVGAARSGTTTLDRCLSQHPEIYMAPRKEVNFFSAHHFPRTGPGDERINREVIRDIHQYTQLFARVAGEKAVGESTVFYLCFPDTAERIAQLVPGAKIIVVLRDPVDRAYSAYLHLLRNGRENLCFEEALRAEEERRQKGYEPMWWYKGLGLYNEQVKHYLDVFGRQRVKVLLYEELFANPEQALRDVFVFLGVDKDAVIDSSLHFNPGGMPQSRKLYSFLDKFIAEPGPLEKRVKSLLPSHLRTRYANKVMSMLLRPVPMNRKAQALLKAYFAEDVSRLEELLGRDLCRWRCEER